MIQEARHFETDLAVIGSGLAGFAASTFALNRGIRTAQAGNTGAIAYTTGYLDLLGRVNNEDICPVNPWEGIRQLAQSQPRHPLARVPETDIRAAFQEFTAFLSDSGIIYNAPGPLNATALTPAGTLKPTLCVPATMQAGVDALARKARCVIVDFKGLRGFSARQVVANLKDTWPGLRAERVLFPDMELGEIYPEVMARALEVPSHREALAERIRGVIDDAEVIGLPAVLGMHNPDLVMAEMQRLLGLPIFEIPTMPPSVPGIRLREMFEQVFPQKGLVLIPQQKVESVVIKADSLQLSLADNFGPVTIQARAVILATGRFLSGGLTAAFDGIREPLIGLPVTQTASREDWYHLQYMDKRGHEVHRAGIEVDEKFRPLGENGLPVSERLFAAGLILAHQDWIRGRCGAGVALASAYKAVEAVQEMLR
ncbi:MAG: glycerol-3-phosphate dehydrogenase subunit GlpB [Desulfoprunum sp.]|nr:glycerol-3-phosphate dehydrogenase subunit GlpB [Desulfoprunum sp.]